MDRGHGALGLLDRLPLFRDLVRSGTARPFLELRPKKTLTGWSVHSGSVYKTTLSAASLTYAGVLRAVVGVESGVGTKLLARVERLTDVNAAGRWFYDYDALVAGGTTDLYVWLPGNADPATTTVVAHLLFTFGTRGEVYPFVSGQAKADNLGLNTWPSSTNLDGFIEENVGATGVVITQETVDVVEGSSSATIEPGGSGLAAGTGGGFRTLGSVVVDGGLYLLGCAYKTGPGLHPDLSARIRARQGVGDSLLEDGVNTTSSDAGMKLRPTEGEWRRASFLYRAPSTITNCMISGRLFNEGAGAVTGGFVRFDDFFWQRVYLSPLFAAALASGSIPELETRAANHLFGPKTIGSGSVSLLDLNGELAAALAQLLVENCTATVYVGGTAFGQDLPRDAWRVGFPAIARDAEVNDSEIVIPMENALAMSRVLVPPNAHRLADEPDLDPAQDGKPKQLLFGEGGTHNVRGVRVDLTANGYGIYELLDPAVPVADNVDVVLPPGYSVKVYPNEELANQDVNGYDIATPITSSSAANPSTITTARPHGLVSGQTVVISGHSNVALNTSKVATVTGPSTFTVPTAGGYTGGTDGKALNTADLTVGTNNTRWSVLRDIWNMRYNRGGDDVVGAGLIFDFNIGGGQLEAFTVIDGPPYRVAIALAASMNAAAGSPSPAITVTYDESTHKFTVARSSGTLQLITRRGVVAAAAGPNAHQEAWDLLGFNTSTDKTGASTYTAGKALFTSPEANHVLRFLAGGYADDAAGSICGVASVAIDSPPAVASWIIQKVMRHPAAKVDVAGTFKAAREACRTTDFSILYAALQNPEDAYAALAWLGQLGMIDFVLDGEGVFYAIKYSASVAGAVELSDLDYLTWRMRRNPAAIFSEIRVQGAYNPALGRFMTWADDGVALDDGIPVKYGVESRPLVVRGYLAASVITGGVQQAGAYYGRLVSRVPRLAEFSVAGKLLDKLVGHKVILRRSRAWDPTGTLGMSPRAITSSSVANPSVITTPDPHHLKSGHLVRIAGHSGSSPAIDGDHRVAVTGEKTFTIPVNVGTGGTGGTFVQVPAFRIIGLRHNYLNGVTQCTAVEDIDFTTP